MLQKFLSIFCQVSLVSRCLKSFAPRRFPRVAATGFSWCHTTRCLSTDQFSFSLAARVSHDSPKTPNVHISGPGASINHPNSTKRPQEKKENCGGRGQKKFWAFGAPHFTSGPHPSGPPGDPRRTRLPSRKRSKPSLGNLTLAKK